MPQKKPRTTKSHFKTSALSFQFESKCDLCLKKSPVRQNPSSKHPLYHFKSSPNVIYASKKNPVRQNPSSKLPLYHFKSSPNVIYASKKAPYDKIRLQNIRFIISNRVQMRSMPQKKPRTTKSDFKTSALSFQIASKCDLCLKNRPVR